MMIRTSILFVVAVTVAHAELSEEAARTLRSLSALPHLTMEFNWSATIESTRCPDFFVGTNELARQVIALRRELIQSPGDPERFLQLGQFLDTLDRDQEAKEAYANAARLFEPRAQASPRDGQLQARFAEALRESGKPEEAEQILHAAVRTTPGVWHCWVGLGESLDSKGSKAIGGGLATGKAGLSTPKLLTEIGRWHPTEGQRNEAEAAWKEADNCFDKAVSLASQDAEAYLARASHRLRTLVKRRLIVRLRKKEKLTQNDKIKDVAAVMVSAEVCEDMAEAARLCPTNYVAVAWEGFAEFFLATASGDSSDRKLLDQIPAVRRKALLDTMQRLEKLADHPNLRVASGALETLGTIRLVSDPDLAGARAAFRRAFTLDRSRRQAWDIWIGLMADTEDWKAMVTACEERLQFEDDAPIRLVIQSVRPG